MSDETLKPAYQRVILKLSGATQGGMRFEGDIPVAIVPSVIDSAARKGTRR